MSILCHSRGYLKMAAGVTIFHQVCFRKIGNDLLGDGGEVTNTELQVSLKEHTLIFRFPKGSTLITRDRLCSHSAHIHGSYDRSYPWFRLHTIENLQVEVSEDEFGIYRPGPLSVLLKYSPGNLLVRVASTEGK